jgi:hypothetical protein
MVGKSLHARVARLITLGIRKKDRLVQARRFDMLIDLLKSGENARLSGQVDQILRGKIPFTRPSALPSHEQ